MSPRSNPLPSRANKKRAARYQFKPRPITNVQTLKTEFYGTNNPATRQQVLRRVESFGPAPHYMFVAGEMCLELAHARGQSPDRSASWLERAQKNWAQTIEGSKQLTHLVGRAGAQLALASTHYSHVVEKKIPDVDTITADYHKMLEVVREQAETLKYSDERSERIRDIAGALGEWSVSLLGMRFSIHNGDGSWMVLPSHLGQDMGSRGKAGRKKDSWDTSIFTQYDPDSLPELTYKIQTKTRQVPNEDRYEDDITVVHVFDDLDISAGRARKGVPASRIPLECHAEVFSDDPSLVSISSKGLDLRENLLLDLLG